ncbi:MAG: carboxylesterase, type [Sphaerisporangium sp.]|nr:carboxylesterase, type [Sphaerisporangium sp.]
MIADTPHGKVRGRTVDGVTAFLGIPYAAAPFGPNRFAPPAPPESWDGVRDALAYGPTAPKVSYDPPLDRLLADPAVPGDECLNLNVWTPGGSGLPVMVWFHGGSLRYGSSAVPVYDGTAFARDGVVLVSVNYRLGIEGFGVFPDAPANLGLLDLLAALRWVQDGIAAFGGDPGNVTVFGESAGAIAIGALLASRRGEGLFGRAVLQSGAPVAKPLKEAGRVTRLIARRLGVPATAAAFTAVDRDRLLAAQVEVTRSGAALGDGNGFQIAADGDLIPEVPLTTPAGVDLMVGYNSEEYRLWFVPTGAVDRIGNTTLRLALMKFRVPQRAPRIYRANRPGAKPGEILGHIAGDLLLRAPLNRIADARGPGRTHMYEFAWPSPVEGLGACHAMEIGFVFDTLRSPAATALAGPDAPQGLADEMHRAWIAFAATGDPGWPGWDSTRPVMRFGTPSELIRAPLDDELALWPGTERRGRR